MMNWFEQAGLDYAEFQQQYWRKQPWHGHNVFDTASGGTLDTISKTLNKKGLYQLSEIPLVESRIIANTQPSANPAATDTANYELELGPFAIAALAPGEMLMLQGLEQHLQSISDLLTRHFGFLPRWRIDDVMASYGDAGASCGPHFDHYDVFLLQVRGAKHWQLAPGPFSDADLIEDAEIRLLQHFPGQQTLTQVPGDLLYLPPGVGHYGVASDDSLTLSIGLRNPTLAEMVSSLADLVSDELSTLQGSSTLDDRLGEPGMGLVTADIDQLKAKLVPELTRSGTMSRWFGCYMTLLQAPELLDQDHQDDNDIDIDWTTARGELHCHLATRLCHQAFAEHGMIFVNGEAADVDRSVLAWFGILETQRHLDLEQIPADSAHRTLIEDLLDQGALHFRPTTAS